MGGRERVVGIDCQGHRKSNSKLAVIEVGSTFSDYSPIRYFDDYENETISSPLVAKDWSIVAAIVKL